MKAFANGTEARNWGRENAAGQFSCLVCSVLTHRCVVGPMVNAYDAVVWMFAFTGVHA
jgi:hypothetical protein